MKELSLNILDIAQNSVTAKSTLIRIDLVEDAETLKITVSDNGCGMSKEMVESVTSPFTTSRTTRKVGMGIPLFKMAAEMTGGSLEIESEVGIGTKVRATFKTDHVDFTPIGDLTSTVVILITMNLHTDFLYRRSLDGKEFTVDTRQLKEILGDVPLNEPGITGWLTDYIKENTNQLTEV